MELILGMIVPPCTFLAWMAYNEPVQFKHKLQILMGLPALVWFAFAVWMWAIKWVRSQARDILDSEAFRKLSTLLAGAEPSPPVMMAAAVGGVLFFTILRLWVCEMKNDKP